MKILEINATEFAEETLVSYKGYKFSVTTQPSGSYDFERRVYIRVIKDNLESFVLQEVGILRLFSDNDVAKDSQKEGCLIIGKTTYSVCLERAKGFIIEYVDFIKED